MQLTSVDKAFELVLTNTLSFGYETIDFQESEGRVLAENITADRDFPPFDRVTMDGIALQGDAYLNGQRLFDIENIQYAGEVQKELINKNSCIEIMTGASLPLGTDSVIRYEDITIDDGKTLLKDGLSMFKNIHGKGHDRTMGEVLLPIGHPLKSADLAVLSSTGNENVRVNALPKVAIVTSGDELVAVHETPKAHQIRKSNIYAISSLLKPYAANIQHFHIIDDLKESIDKLSAICQNFDVLVLSGGVSAGKKDYLPEALEAIGVKKLFHKIAQRPGKPMWFGRKENLIAFALPGNPVSSFMCAIRYVLPWLKKSIGINGVEETAILAQDVIFKPTLSYFMQVKLLQVKGVLKAYPFEGSGSGDLANLSLSDAFLELENQDSEVYLAGETYRFWRF
jgi:molybdopterin molybdotransferase